MKRATLVSLGLLLFGGIRLPVEHALFTARAQRHLVAVPVDLTFAEQVSQLGFAALLSGLRSLLADIVFIQAHVAWEQTEWSRVLILFREATALQPHATLFWDMAAWHMAWNASIAAMNNRSEPSELRRTKASREYIDIGRDFLERGIRNNPDEPKLYEALARLYRDRLGDHLHASEFYAKAAANPGAAAYAERFAAYELSYCEGEERRAYDWLLRLYQRSENERLPTLIKRLKYLEERLNIPPSQRIPDEVR
ncbi:MAG: hypothetical protein M3032_12740 [Verrucomicrobiota bacterium]|nr:hypothetical protein [Verrucomicrobiota bacterium]